MSELFRENVASVAQSGLEIMSKYLKGDEGVDENRVRQAARMIGFGVKVEHMNQTRELQTKSLALRLVKLLPQDEEVRNEYIKLTNPDVRPLLAEKIEK